MVADRVQLECGRMPKKARVSLPLCVGLKLNWLPSIPVFLCFLNV